jgi:pimeloyl-ACP methyl ester carboxylesterase
MKKNHIPFAIKIIRWIYPKLERFVPGIAHRYFVKIFFTPFRYKTPVKEKKAETFAEKFTIRATGKKIQCYAWGHGEKLVLFVHGWAGRSTQFRRFIKPLITAGYRVVGFDGPAHGNSEGKETNLMEFEEALRRIYDKLGEPHAIISHSFGGGAVLFAAMNGLHVNKLIAIACPAIGDEIIKTYLRAINGSASTADFFRSYMIKTYHKPFDEFTSLHFVKHLSQKVDLLLVHDEDDREVSIDHALALGKSYPEAKIHKTQGLGHTRILKNDDVIRYCVTYIDS